MGSVPDLLYRRWASGDLVGDAKHSLTVRLRPGRMYRRFKTETRIDNGELIRPPLLYGCMNQPCWQGIWTPSGPWVTLPNVESAKFARDFTSKGISALTVIMDNIAFVEEEGIAGLYHTYVRGYYSPMRGTAVNGRRPASPRNEWNDVLNSGYQVELWEGYGTGAEVVPLATPDPTTHSCAPPGGAISRTWTGIAENCDSEANPDKITLTARDFGLLFTDQRMMGNNKSKDIRAPVTFGDRKSALKTGSGLLKGWVLVDDVSDVIKTLFIWAGFKEWYLHRTGWSIFKPLQYGEDKFFVDIIDDVLTQGNFVFYMLAPTDDDRSIGVPYFGPQKATDPPRPGMLDVRDTTRTEALQVKWDTSALPYVMRVRGDIDPKGHGLDELTVKRFMGVYYPPWSGTPYASRDPLDFRTKGTGRVAGVLRHFTETLGVTTTVSLNSNEECLFACVLAAIQYALGMCTGQFQMAGLPGVELNQQVNVVEEATGVDSRLWVASIQSDHSVGPNGLWTMTVGGSMIDTEDMAALAGDYSYTAALNTVAKRASFA